LGLVQAVVPSGLSTTIQPHQSRQPPPHIYSLTSTIIVAFSVVDSGLAVN
jgi:hypothetical protein